MLGEKKWYSEPDDSIEVWLFLILETETSSEEQYISAWHVGGANPQRITYSESMKIDSLQLEGELLSGLLEELRPYRYNSVTIITPSTDAIRLLRTRLILSSVESPTLRGFTHLSVMDLIMDHFSVEVELPNRITSTNQYHTASVPRVSMEDLDIASYHSSIEQLWKLYQKVSPLVPEEPLSGSGL